MEGDRPVQRLFPGYPGISIHSLRMEGDRHMLPRLRHALISIHSLRMEGDKIRLGLFFQLGHFNPLPPHGGRQEYISGCEVGTVFQSTPSAWRETQAIRIPCPPVCISIHSLRMEEDLVFLYILIHREKFQSTPSAWRETQAIRIPCPPVCISIHSLRMEEDLVFLYILIHREKFQSTPSAWRETRADYVSQQRWLDFNPLPPHGGRLYILDECKLTERISIHSLRMEGDAKILFHVKRFLIFQSTPSAWRETFRGADDISGNLFQSTPSAWRETQGKRFCA